MVLIWPASMRVAVDIGVRPLMPENAVPTVKNSPTAIRINLSVPSSYDSFDDVMRWNAFWDKPTLLHYPASHRILRSETRFTTLHGPFILPDVQSQDRRWSRRADAVLPVNHFLLLHNRTQTVLPAFSVYDLGSLACALGQYYTLHKGLPIDPA